MVGHSQIMLTHLQTGTISPKHYIVKVVALLRVTRCVAVWSRSAEQVYMCISVCEREVGSQAKQNANGNCFAP